MYVDQPAARFTELPDPAEARVLSDLVERLRSLKIWAGDPSYDTIKDRVNAAWSLSGRPAGELVKRATVADCFKSGRRRLNTDLVAAVVSALHPEAGYVAQWRQALRVVCNAAHAAAQVRARDALPVRPGAQHHVFGNDKLLVTPKNTLSDLWNGTDRRWNGTERH